MLHIGAQGINCCLCICQCFGGQHFNTLSQQYCRFALDLHLVLQVFDPFHTLRELSLQGEQWLFTQRCSRFGGITLPSKGVCNIEFGGVDQGLRFGRPFSTQCFLTFGTTGLIELFSHQFGGALVFHAELFEDVSQLFVARLGQQPVTNAGRTLPRSGSGKGSASQTVQRGDISVFSRLVRRHSELRVKWV